MKITAITTWEGTPAALLVLVEASKAAAEIHKGFGAKNPRLLQAMVGGNPNILNYAVDFDSMEDYTSFVNQALGSGWWDGMMKRVAEGYPDLKMAGQTLMRNAIE
jgi:hypothetical protein